MAICTFRNPVRIKPKPPFYIRDFSLWAFRRSNSTGTA